MKNPLLLSYCLAVLASITVYSCKSKKPAAGVKTTTTAVPADTVTVFTYNGQIKNIIEKACLQCHLSPLPGPGPAFPHEEPGLDSYEALKKAAVHPNFLGAINHEAGFPKMPLHKDKLDEDLIRKITSWVQNGMRE